MTLQQNKILLFAALFFAALGLNAQGDIIQVVTKKVEKHFSFKDGYELNVEGEKALVTIDTWDKDEIFVTLELVSKHTDAKVAEKDLEALNYVMKRIKNKVYLRNFLASEDGVRVKVSSTLLIKYKIFLPDNCPVYIKNHFGEAHVAQLKNSLVLDLDII